MITLDEYSLTEDQKTKVQQYIKVLTSTEAMPFKACPYFDRCEDQVCPMDPNNQDMIWYSNEGPCFNPEFKENLSVINQKKLSKKNAQGYFTFEMLNRDIIIRRGIQGIDPDVPEAIEKRGQEAIDSLYRNRKQAWIRDHPELTEEQREKMRLKAAIGIEALNKYREGDQK
jgi:hypothetical protein